MNARSEALLWIQLLGLPALPLEVLLLLLLFAGADPGPVPSVERLLVWGLGALLPALLLWQRPPDVWSLLLAQVPLRGRRPQQQRLSALQVGPGLQLARASGAVLLLPISWWADQHAGLATGLSPFDSSGRLVVLLISVPLLALMLWQWQQLVQALRLLSLDDAALEAAPPLALAELEQNRLSLGLPVLMINPLRRDQRPAQASQPEPRPVPTPRPTATEEAVQGNPAKGVATNPAKTTTTTLPSVDRGDGPPEGEELIGTKGSTGKTGPGLHPPGDLEFPAKAPIDRPAEPSDPALAPGASTEDQHEGNATGSAAPSPGHGAAAAEVQPAVGDGPDGRPKAPDPADGSPGEISVTGSAETARPEDEGAEAPIPETKCPEGAASEEVAAEATPPPEPVHINDTNGAQGS
ncbi:low-complexity tail membrane protein [Cyanobium sp. Morenito 9A2]|uniref:low-complexity tail membrane protein n=1 Tax=Cyanobium sp. Morenito 9A2 TaxID=2823718 RepID=UPI0020CF274F|nr:low-complexity tail membrane protein [Cyanobium sp. Morenito 9A2]MCP9849187.1 low-complexity tail membrane protein [Cyanobium sp. Morenito 9A2]